MMRPMLPFMAVMFATIVLLAYVPAFSALVEAGLDTQKREWALWAAETDKYVKRATEQGAEINDDVDVPAFRKAVKPVVDKYRSSFGNLLDLLPIV